MDPTLKKLLIRIAIAMTVLPYAVALFYGIFLPREKPRFAAPAEVPMMETPSADTRRIGTLPPGEVQLLGITGEYAQVEYDGKTGYVKFELLEQITAAAGRGEAEANGGVCEKAAVGKTPDRASAAQGTGAPSAAASGARPDAGKPTTAGDGNAAGPGVLALWKLLGWVFLAGTLLLTLSTAVIRWRRSDKLIHDWEPAYGSYQSQLYALFVCETGYFLTMFRHEPLWFCNPGRVGWWMAIASFALFAFVCYNHFMALILMLRSRARRARAYKLDWKIGFKSIWYGAIAAGICSRVFRQPEAVLFWVLVGVAVCQIVQIGRIRRLMPDGAAATAWLYGSGIVSLLVMLVFFIPLAVIAAIVCIVAVGFFQSHGLVTTEPGPPEPKLFYGPDGREYYMTDLGNNFARDQYGNDWMNQGPGKYKRL